MMHLLLASIKAANVVLIIGLTCLFLPAISSAKDFRDLYPLKKLQHVQKVYGNNIRGVLYEDIHHYLLPNERRSLSKVKLSVPLYSSDAGIFDFQMNLQTGEMTIPALSVKFFDDMALAFAWYEHKQMDKAKIIEYVARLYAQQGYMQPPLVALGVPEQAWKLSDYVDDVSQKILKSGLAYLFLHELGHWHYQHAPYDSISNRQAQAQEMQSDLMALEVMGRMRTIPYGIVTWFLVTGLLQDNNPTTHPLSADRLYAIADKIEENPALFISKENENILSINEVLSVASNIRTIATEITTVKK